MDWPEAGGINLDVTTKSSLSSDCRSSAVYLTIQSEMRKESLLELFIDIAKEEQGLFFKIGSTKQKFA